MLREVHQRVEDLCIERDRFAGFAPQQQPAAHVDDESGDFQVGRGRFHVHEHNKSVFFIEPPKIFTRSAARFPFDEFTKSKGRNTCDGESFSPWWCCWWRQPQARLLRNRAQHTRTCGGEACDAVFRGFFAFFDRSLHGLDGNGRSCADCHMPSDQFQLSPASAEARFQLLQARRRWNPRADDPLFRPIDADDFRLNGAARQRFSQSARERPGAHRVLAAAEHAADRSGHQSTVGGNLGRCLAHGSECQ